MVDGRMYWLDMIACSTTGTRCVISWGSVLMKRKLLTRMMMASRAALVEAGTAEVATVLPRSHARGRVHGRPRNFSGNDGGNLSTVFAPKLEAFESAIHRDLIAPEIVLFGSRFLGTARPKSDIDLIVISDSFQNKGISERRKLCGETLAPISDGWRT